MLTKEEQESYFDAHKEEAWDNVISYIRHRKDIILATGRERLVSNFENYGDESWHRHPHELLHEVIEELADAPVWEVMRLYSEEHMPLGRTRVGYTVARSVPDSPDD